MEMSTTMYIKYAYIMFKTTTRWFLVNFPLSGTPGTRETKNLDFVIIMNQDGYLGSPKHLQSLIVHIH